MSKLRQMLLAHEDCRLKPYRCSKGKLTIGVGRNLEDVGISKAEALALLDNDILRATKQAQVFPWFWNLDDVRADVVIQMIFNMGIGNDVKGFSSFKKLIAALAAADFDVAAKEMLDSQWRKEVGERASLLAEMMRTGRYP